MTKPVLVFLVSQYWSKVLRIRSGVVDEEKLMKTISMSLNSLSVAIRVMVLPEPGGPHRRKGRFSESHEQRTYWCLFVSTVSMTTSASVTLLGSMSRVATRSFQGCQFWS